MSRTTLAAACLLSATLLSGCGTLYQSMAESMYGENRSDLFRVIVQSGDDSDDSIFFREPAAKIKDNLIKDVKEQGISYEDIVQPGNRIAIVTTLGFPAAAYWPVQFDPKRFSLELGTVVTTYITPGIFELSTKKHFRPGDIPGVIDLICQANDRECRADPQRGGTLGVVGPDGRATRAGLF